MNEVQHLIKAFRTPRAGAVSGIIFSLLMITGLFIIRLSFPDVRERQIAPNPAAERGLAITLQLVPYAAIFFLRFVGVLRTQMGEAVDQFLATVFLGSGLLYVATLFGAAAVSGAVLGISQPGIALYSFAHEVGYIFLNIFGIRMASVFIFTTSVIALHIGILPRWMAYIGLACGVTLLLIISRWLWIEMLFPLWTLLVSVSILLHQRKSLS